MNKKITITIEINCNENNKVIWKTFDNDFGILLDDTPLKIKDALPFEVKVEDINEPQKMPQV